MFEKQNWHALQSSNLQVEAAFTDASQLAVPPSCHFKLAWTLFCFTKCACVSPPPPPPTHTHTPTPHTHTTPPTVVVQCMLQWSSSSGITPVAFQCGTVSNKSPSSVPCNYSLGRPMVFQCTLGQPVTIQWHSSVHWASQCTLAQGKGSHSWEV